MLNFISNVLGLEEDEAAKNNKINNRSISMSHDSLLSPISTSPPQATTKIETKSNNLTNNSNKSFTVPNSPDLSMRTKKSFSFDVRNYPDNEACSPLSFGYALLARLNLSLQKEMEKNDFDEESELLDSLNSFVKGLEGDVKTSAKIQLPYREIIQQLISTIDKYKSEREELYIAALSALLIFSRNTISKNEIARVDGINWVCSVMRMFQRSIGIQEWACKLLGSMAICGLNVIKIADSGGIGLIIDAMLVHKFSRSVNIEAWIALGNMAVTEGNDVFRRRIASQGGLGVVRQSLFIHANSVIVTGLCDKCVIARLDNPSSESTSTTEESSSSSEGDQSVNSSVETKEVNPAKDKNSDDELCSVAAKHIVNVLLTPCVHNQKLNDSSDSVVFPSVQSGLGRRSSTGFTIEMRNFSSPSLLMHSSME